jgi:hypothetical protein
MPGAKRELEGETVEKVNARASAFRPYLFVATSRGVRIFGPNLFVSMRFPVLPEALYLVVGELQRS